MQDLKSGYVKMVLDLSRYEEKYYCFVVVVVQHSSYLINVQSLSLYLQKLELIEYKNESPPKFPSNSSSSIRARREVDDEEKKETTNGITYQLVIQKTRGIQK
jgi:hypothetical protein